MRMHVYAVTRTFYYIFDSILSYSILFVLVKLFSFSIYIYRYAQIFPI